MKIETNVSKIDKTFKAGKYIVGDLCYLPWDKVDPRLWNEICDDVLGNEFAILDNAKVFVDYTAYGDGNYILEVLGKNKCEIEKNDLTMDGEVFLPVDAGILSIIDIKILDFFNLTIDEFINTKIGLAIVDIKENFVPSCDDGLFNFGPIQIETN